MRSVMITVLLFLSAASASAQENSHPLFNQPLKLAPILFMAGGQLADGLTTTYKIQQGCGESNTRAFGQQPTNASLWLVKGVTVASLTATLVMLQKTGHPKVAKWLGVFGGSVGLGAAAYNLTVSCR